MSFDTSVISEVTHAREGGRLTLEWTSTAAPGVFYQLYLQGALAWWGTEQHVTVSAPRGLIDVQIGSVADGEQTTDFSKPGFGTGGFGAGGFDGLATAPITTRALLEWIGFGAAEYRIYEGIRGFGHGGFGFGGMGGSAGTLVGTVTGLEQGISTDGFGHSGFGQGGFGVQGGDFSWTSNPLTQGDWNFSVVPYDASGNAGTPSLATVTITAPPRPPVPNTSGKRITYSYNNVAHTVTLNWLASPG